MAPNSHVAGSVAFSLSVHVLPDIQTHNSHLSAQLTHPQPIVTASPYRFKGYSTKVLKLTALPRHCQTYVAWAVQIRDGICELIYLDSFSTLYPLIVQVNYPITQLTRTLLRGRTDQLALLSAGGPDVRFTTALAVVSVTRPSTPVTHYATWISGYRAAVWWVQADTV